MARLLSSPTVAGSLILYARLKAGLSQRELARRLGVSQPVIAAYEAGRRQPTVDNLIRIVRAAGFDLRIGIAPPDEHDTVLANLDQQRLPEDRARWSASQDALVTRAQALLEVPVADLEDILRSKEAAARPKDALHLPILYQTLRRRGEAPPEVGGGSGA